MTLLKLCREKWQTGIYLDVITEGSCTAGWIRAVLRMTCVSLEERLISSHSLGIFKVCVIIRKFFRVCGFWRHLGIISSKYPSYKLDCLLSHSLLIQRQ